MSCSSAKKSFAPKLWSRLLFQMSQAAGEEDRDDLLHFLGMNIVETAKNKSRAKASKSKAKAKVKAKAKAKAKKQ